MREVIHYPDGSTQVIDHPDPPKPEFPTLTGSQFLGMCAQVLGVERVDQLLEKSPTVTALIQRANTVDRNSGNTPLALAYLQTGANALTSQELAAIETAWRNI